MISFVDLDVQNDPDVMSRESQAVARTRKSRFHPPAWSWLDLAFLGHFGASTDPAACCSTAVACSLCRPATRDGGILSDH